MQDKRPTGMNRRNFLGAFGGASPGLSVATAVATAAVEAQAYDPGEEEMRARYQETDHVKAYYRVNSYPTKE